MGRYDLPDPKCQHKRKGIVSAGGGLGEPHAATNVCDRPECMRDAIEWAEAQTRLPARFTPDKPKDDQGTML